MAAMLGEMTRQQAELARSLHALSKRHAATHRVKKRKPRLTKKATAAYLPPAAHTAASAAFTAAAFAPPQPLTAFRPSRSTPTTIPTPPRSMCILCLDSAADCVLYRCGHRCACLRCAHYLRHEKMGCPLCRAPIDDVIRVYE